MLPSHELSPLLKDTLFSEFFLFGYLASKGVKGEFGLVCTELRYMQGNFLEGEGSIRSNQGSLSTMDFKSNHRIIYVGNNHYVH